MIGTDGPWEIAESLARWAQRTSWCDWVELAGSLARDADDALSDVDAGLGVDIDGSTYLVRRDAVLSAVGDFAQVADQLIQHLGTEEKPADHLVIQYADGRQLSLVVMPAGNRPGLPAEGRALFDRTGRLSVPYEPPAFRASSGDLREWSFLGWWALADVAKHVARGRLWRATESLHEARTQVWRLYAAEEGLGYPSFGAVTVENAGCQPPAGLSRSMPRTLAASDLLDASAALMTILDPLSAAHQVAGVRAEAVRRSVSARARRAR